MSNEQKWLHLAIMYSKVARLYAEQGNIEAEKNALASSNDCHERVIQERRKQFHVVG